MNRARPVVAALVGTAVIALSLTACAFAPRPVETRLPPADSAATPTVRPIVPSPSVVPGLPTASTSSAPAPVVSATTPGGVSDPAADTVDCGAGGSRDVTGGERTVRVQGTCDALRISGFALTIDAGTATVGSLSVAGDRIRVSAASIGTVSVQGNDGSVASAGSIDSVAVSGDRTRIDAVGAIGSVVVRGQDNVVRAGSGIGSSSVDGRGNQIG